MEWRALLAALSGPISSGVRSLVIAVCTMAATKFGIENAPVEAVAAGAVAVVTAVIGALTHTKKVKVEATAALPDVAGVKLASGETVVR